MASKSFEVTCGYNGHYHLYMSITENRQDIANNKTNITVKVWAKSDSTSYGAYNLSTTANRVTITVNGSQKLNTTKAMDFRNCATVDLGSWTGDITHSDDGSQKANASASFTISNVGYLTGGNIDGSMTLTPIARASQPSCITWPNNTQSVGDLGTAITIHMNKNASFTHTVRYSWGSSTGQIATNVVDNCRWTIPLSFANNIPNSTSGTGTIYVDTYNGSSLVGTKSCLFTCTVPASMVPSISSITVSEANANLSSFGGTFVQSKSNIKISCSTSTSYGSAISSIYHQIDKMNIRVNDKSSFTPIYSGNYVVTTVITDGRGRTARATKTFAVEPYSAPQITKFDVVRCNDDGTISQNGTRIKITTAFSISNVLNKNGKSYSFEYATKGDSTFTKLLSSNDVYAFPNDTYPDGYVITDGLFNIGGSYVIRLTVSDSLSSAVVEKTISAASRLISGIPEKIGIAIGKIAELANTLEVDLYSAFNKVVHFKDNLELEKNIIVYNDLSVSDVTRSKNVLQYNSNASKLSTDCVVANKSITASSYLGNTKLNANESYTLQTTSNICSDYSGHYFTMHPAGIGCNYAGTIQVRVQMIFFEVPTGARVTVSVRANDVVKVYMTTTATAGYFTAIIPPYDFNINAGEVISVHYMWDKACYLVSRYNTCFLGVEYKS